MRLLRYDDNNCLTITAFNDDVLPRYAILSHTWGADADEVTFADLAEGGSEDKLGYKKIRFSEAFAARKDVRQLLCLDLKLRYKLSGILSTRRRV
jgi:hypothetical protein